MVLLDDQILGKHLEETIPNHYSKCPLVVENTVVHWRYLVTVSKYHYAVVKITLAGKHGN